MLKKSLALISQSLLIGVVLIVGILIYTPAAKAQTEPALKEVPQSKDLQQPMVLKSKDGELSIVLQVKYDKGKIGSDEVCLRSYKLLDLRQGEKENPQSEIPKFVAPTLKVNPGDKLKIDIVNNLPEHPDFTPCENTNPLATRKPPESEHFNVTNLHTHGLEVSPGGIGNLTERPYSKPPYSDNVYVEIKPGGQAQYEFNIPKDHAPGTFWYHPHMHYSTAVQVSSGMEGALIVENPDSRLEQELKQQEVKDVIFVLQQIPYSPGITYMEGDATVEDFNAAFDPSSWGNLRRRSSINGQDFPKITLNKGEVQRWRFIHGGVRETVDLRLVPKEGFAQLDKRYIEPLDMNEIAVDGLSLGKMVPKKDINLYPGYRSDVFVQVDKPGTYFLIDYSEPRRTSDADSSFSLFHELEELKLLAEVEVKDHPNQITMDLSSIDLASLAPPPFKPVKDEEIQNLGNPRTLEFNIVSVNGQSQFQADGTEYKPEHPPLALPLGAAEELVVYSRRGGHPFHIHVNPFEVVAIGEGDTTQGSSSLSQIVWTEPEGYPVWKDTIMVTPQQPVKLRIRYNEKYPGITVYHCHILDHEDQGMMRAIEFTSTLPEVVSSK
jgi:FtsP/CotA-like multicopper oxidase with cupredoxin domain